MKVKNILKDGSVWIPGTGYDRSQPIVSVLLPTFKRAKSGLFEKAVQSVLNQDLKQIELIIIDDCSTDGTSDLIEHFMKLDSRVSCIRHSYNVGLPAISEYEGYIKAKGEYIAFIFDDNHWEKNYLDKTISYMVRKKVKATYGIVRSYYGDGASEFIELGNPNFQTTSISDLWATNFIANGGVVLHRKVIEAVGLYDPHLTLTRLCDWDLWRRVIREFAFEGTGIFASSEHGAKLKDSLGNTVQMNSWCSIEQMSKLRNNQLKAESFGEYDICGVDSKNTDLFIDSIKSFLMQYEKKEWYVAKSFKNKDILHKNEKRKHVVVFSNEFNATTTLSFERLAQGCNDLIFRFATSLTLNKSELIYADAFICIRDFKYADEYINVCNEFAIPCYYYVDDNFVELAKEYKNNLQIKMIAKGTNYHEMNRFEGVFLSTQALKDYFKKNKFHENLILMEPIINADNINEFKENKGFEEVTIAFMGGQFRMDIFEKILLPALERLAKNKKITLILPQQNIDQLRTYSKFLAEIRLVEISRSLSLELTLYRYGLYKPDILVHCGPDIKNNQFKTENSLINAVQLGAVLVASNVLPYKDQNNANKRFVLSENTELDWYETLNKLIDNSEERKKIYENAKEYCIGRYSTEKVAEVIMKEFEKLKNTSYWEILKRLEHLYCDLFYQKSSFCVGNIESGIKYSRSLLEVPLCFTKLIDKTTCYKIRCKTNVFCELGICFASFGESAGYVKIKLLEGKNQVREASFNLEDYVRDDWTYVQIQPITDAMNKVFTIKLEFCYNPGSAHVGVFEDSTKRSFMYKVLNKLGYHLKGLDVLFVDCR